MAVVNFPRAKCRRPSRFADLDVLEREMNRARKVLNAHPAPDPYALAEYMRVRKLLDEVEAAEHYWKRVKPKM